MDRQSMVRGRVTIIQAQPISGLPRGCTILPQSGSKLLNSSTRESTVSGNLPLNTCEDVNYISKRLFLRDSDPQGESKQQ